MARILTFEAQEADNGRYVRSILKEEFHLVAHDISRAKFETEDGITVDGRFVRASHQMKTGEILRVRLEDRPGGNIVPTEGPIDILYEDEDLIALNKPAGLVVHPSHGHYADSLGNYLAWYYESQGDPHEVRTIGRLDKDTSGVIVFGKSRSAVSVIDRQSEQGLRKKYYLALAHGTFSGKEGTVNAPIKREIPEEMKRVVRETGDYAVTHYRVLAQLEEYAVLEVSIETGRTHQIRVHMSYIGHPLLGDSLYGCPGENRFGIGRTALHSWRTEFVQPFDGRPIRLEAPVPEDMRRLIPCYF